MCLAIYAGLLPSRVVSCVDVNCLGILILHIVMSSARKQIIPFMLFCVAFFFLCSLYIFAQTSSVAEFVTSTFHTVGDSEMEY